MKINKKQLKQIIQEEIDGLTEKVKPDVERINKIMGARGITDLVSQRINTWQELQDLLAGIISMAPVKDNQKAVVLRKLLAQLQGGDSGDAAEAPPPGAPPADGGGM